MKEKIESMDPEQKEKRPYPSEEEKLAEIRANFKKSGEKAVDYSLHPQTIDRHEKKYKDES